MRYHVVNVVLHLNNYQLTTPNEVAEATSGVDDIAERGRYEGGICIIVTIRVYKYQKLIERSRKIYNCKFSNSS